MKSNALLNIVLTSAAMALTSCSSYVNSPTARAARVKQSEAFSHPLIAHAYNAKPTIHFPATIVVAPMGGGAQQELRALDAFGKLDSLKSLPQVKDITTLSSLLMSDRDGEIEGSNGKSAPIWNKSDLILREAAAKMHADAVLLIQLETNITDGKIFTPLTTLSLGLFPNDRAEVIATALAALVDTRTGYVYATAERSAGRTCYAMSWDDSTRDRARERATRSALEKLLTEFPAVWRGVVQTHRK